MTTTDVAVELITVVIDGFEKPVHNSKWTWLDPLPNFDPFEDKGKGYFSDCKMVGLT